MLLWLKKLQLILLVCLAVSLPFNIAHFNMNSYAIVLLSFNSIILFFLSKREERPSGKGWFILFITFFLIHIAGVLKTENTHEAVLELQRKMSLLVFPFILFFTPRLYFREIRIILSSFVISCIATGFFCLLGAAYLFFIKNDSSYFFYHALSGMVGMHAAYLSMYFSFSIFLLVYFNKQIKFSFSNTILFYSSLFLLFAMVLLLSGRTQIIILLTGIVIFFTYWLNKRWNIIASIAGAVSISIIIAGMVLLIPTNRERFKEAFNYDIGNRWGEQQGRYLMWTCASELIKTNFITGVGTGDVQDVLQECYIDRQYISLTYLKNTRFNAHNQFLETTIELGVFGLFVLLLIIISTLIYAIKQRNKFYLIFIFIFSVSCFTESMLERQNGIVFFSFFNSLLFLYNIKNMEEEV